MQSNPNIAGPASDRGSVCMRGCVGLQPDTLHCRPRRTGISKRGLLPASLTAGVRACFASHRHTQWGQLLASLALPLKRQHRFWSPVVHFGVQARCQHSGVQARCQHSGVQARCQHSGVQARCQHLAVQARCQHPGGVKPGASTGLTGPVAPSPSPSLWCCHTATSH
eukprot:360684-Chlamydomonas_euryale.AAC.3